MNNGEIVERLDILILLLIPPYEEEKYPIKGLGLDILRLCEMQVTANEMVKMLNKSRSVIDNTLSKLRSLGLIRSVVKESRTVYLRIR